MLGRLMQIKVIFTLCAVIAVGQPFMAHGISHACKSCSRARNSYVNYAYEYLCDTRTGIKAQMQGLLQSLASRQRELNHLQTQLASCNGVIQCRRLTRAVTRKQRQIDRLLARLLAIVRLLANDCQRSRQLEERKNCEVREAAKYCDPLDAALQQGSQTGQINAAYNALVVRCGDLHQEKNVRKAVCKPTATPTRTATPTATPTATATPSPTDSPAIVATATPTAVPNTMPV